MDERYHVVRVAVDCRGRPISGSVECRNHVACTGLVVDVGPFDTVEDVVVAVTDLLEMQLTLW